MEYIDIDDVIKSASDFLLHPEDEAITAEFEKIKRQLIIKKHLPIAQREAVILKTLIDVRSIDSELNLGQIANAFEISLTFNAILAYTNIDPDINVIYKDDIFYDVLWESGFIDYILNFCRSDYERVEKQIYQAVSYNNMVQLMENIDALNLDKMDDLTKKIKDYTLDMDPDMIKNLAEIAKMNDPLLNDLKNNLVEGAYKAIKENE